MIIRAVQPIPVAIYRQLAATLNNSLKRPPGALLPGFSF